MISPGESDDDDLLVRSRSALLDAIEALKEHRDSVIVIGAQAIYLRTSSSLVALAEVTKDSDLALDPRQLEDEPLIEVAMTSAGFFRDLESGQPGSWFNPEGIPVDLMVPEMFAGGSKKGARGGRIPPHHKNAMRRARGLEAAIVDNDIMEVPSLDPGDARRYTVRVAGLAALLIAKAHKIAERVAGSPHRLLDKDAHDMYRILVDMETGFLAARFEYLLADQISSEVANEALGHLGELFAGGPGATGAMMAGRAEEGIGEPDTVALQASILASDLLESIG